MRTAILTLALGASAFTAASAQDMPPRGPGGAMMRADADGDGIVTRAEALAEAGARFDRIDANHDGRIDQTELTAIADRRGRRNGAPPAPPLPAK
jgi:hypothetical protein